MLRHLYPTASSRRFVYGLFTTLSVASIGAVSYHRYTIHADADDDKSDYQVYRDLVRSASSNRRSLQPVYRPPLEQGIYYFMNPDTGILRYDSASDYRHPLWSLSDAKSITVGGGPTWTAFAIYQGIFGLDACAFVHRYLLDDILNDVAQITFKYYPTDDNHEEVGSTIPSEEVVKPLSDSLDDIVRNNFIEMQDYIVDRGLEDILSSPSRSAAAVPLCRAVSGCACFVALYDSDSALLKVVTTGNSRAVLGRCAQPEKARWKYQVHEIPSPTQKATSGRYSSGDYSNAFGLAMQRWNQDVQDRLRREYLTPIVGNLEFIGSDAIEPCIESIKIQPGDFLVAGTDALWDAFTSEEVVDLVNIWLKHEHKSLKEHQSDAPSVVTLSGPQTTLQENRGRQRQSIDKQFQCTDINAASHIIKNALNQDRYYLTSATQTTPGHQDTKKRNGMGLLVIFFDDCRSPVHENLILLSSKGDSSTDDR